jgi:hypothetical protein
MSLLRSVNPQDVRQCLHWSQCVVEAMPSHAEACQSSGAYPAGVTSAQTAGQQLAAFPSGLGSEISFCHTIDPL